MSNYKYRLARGVGLSSLAVALGLSAVPAVAQNADAGSEAITNSIVVTGSRIVRRDAVANSPIVTVTQETLADRSTISVEDALNEMPQFTIGGSSALSSSAGTAFTGANEAPGAATLDLRGLGGNRTLVLVNGRRAQPVNASLLIDVNTIPSAAIKTVEVITGGAAAVYGADAIAGVVNFILRNDFEGIDLDAQASISEAGDAETYQISGLVGGNFGDGRGNAMFSASYADRKPAYQRNRDFFTNGWNDPNTAIVAGAFPVTSAVIGGVTYGVNTDGSLYVVSNAADPNRPYKGPLNNLAGGAGMKLNPASPGTTNQSLGYNDPNNYSNIPLSRWSMFGAARYELTDHVELFVEGNFNHTKAYAQSFPGAASNIWGISVPYDPANDDPDSPTFGANQSTFRPVSRELADLLNARANPSAPWSLSRGLNFLGRLYTETTSDIFQVTGGLRGDLGVRDWSWEVYGSHGNTSVIARQPQGAISHANLQQIFSGKASSGAPSVTINGPWSMGWTSGATFNPSTCTSGIPLFNADGTLPSAIPGSGEGVVVSDDCKSYLTLELNNITKLQQNVLEGTLQGSLLENWAGDVRFAVGATYRDANFSYAPDTGNSGEQAGTNVINQIALPKPTNGEIDVKEIYGELLIPLLADLPFIKKLDLEVGGRYSDYSLSGQIGTYKILGDWQLNDWFRIRGGYQRANRAPNIYELFAPVAGGMGVSQDPCVNIDNFTPDFGNKAGNPNLLNLQEACKALIVRDGGFAYTTLGDDPMAVAQNPGLFPNLDRTRLSNHRNILTYNVPFPISVGLAQGNTALKSEVANTITIGGVLNSPFNSGLLSRLTMTVDYYSIDLKGTIGSPTGVEIYTQCLSPEFNPLMSSAFGTHTGAELLEGNSYCNLINRYPFDENGVLGAPGSGTDRTYNAQFINKGGTKTSGLDVTVNWTAAFDDMGIGIPGSLNFYGSANVLLGYSEASYPGAEYVEYKGTLEQTAFDYKLFGSLSYAVGRGSIGIRGNYLPAIDPSPFAAPGTKGTKSHSEFSLFGRFDVTDTLELRAGVDNLFNAQPEVVGATATDAKSNTTMSVYDTIGRSYYFGLRYKM